MSEHVAACHVDGLTAARINAVLCTEGATEEVTLDVTLEEVDHDITRGVAFKAATEHIFVDGGTRTVDGDRCRSPHYQPDRRHIHC